MSYWIRFSGASPKLLEKTGDFYESESIKYTRYGVLVFIPAILGAISGGYAISTIVENQIIIGTFAVIWFFVILFIDMAISATMYKSNRSGKIEFFITVIFRLIFAICVGMVISHPLVLRVFEESINKNIIERNRINYEEDIINAQASLIDAQKPFEEQIINLKNKNECLATLIQFETSAKNTKENVKEFFDKNNISCGFNSGLGAGCTSECKERKNLINQNNKKIKELEEQMKIGTKIQQDILNDANMRKDISPPTDYLERTEALDVLKNGDGKYFKPRPHVSVAANMLICFFVFLDILIVLLKALTPMGAYEHTKDFYLDRHIETLKLLNALETKRSEDSQEILNKIAVKKLGMEEASGLFAHSLDLLSTNALIYDKYKKDRKNKFKISIFSIFEDKKDKQQEQFDELRSKEELREVDELYLKVQQATRNSLNDNLSELLYEKKKREKDNDI